MKIIKLKYILLAILLSNFYYVSFSQCACCAGAGIGSSTGDFNNGVLTLEKKKFLVETYGDYRTIKDAGAPEEDERLLTSMFIGSAGIRYGVSNRITLSVLVPYVFLHTNNGSDKGVGDAILMATTQLVSKDKLNVALQTGIELPTGTSKPSSFDNTTVIVGSGSYDPMMGIVLSTSWNKYSLTANTLYKHTTKGFNHNYYGSISLQNLTLSYKVKGGNNNCSIDSLQKNSSKIGWVLFGGYYGEWLDKLKEEGVVDNNSGYYAGFFNVGSNFSIKKYAFPLTLSISVINKMNGVQNPPGYRVRLGIIRAL